MSFHNRSYDEYLKQFYQGQSDIKKNILRFDLGVNNQALTTGPQNVHNLRGGAVSSQDIYTLNQQLFKKRSQDLEAISSGTFTTPYKGEPSIELSSNSGQALRTKIQKLAFSITGGNSTNSLLNELFDIITFIQQNGYLLREEEITEAIDNLDEIEQMLILELGNSKSQDTKYDFFKSCKEIVKRIIQLLKKVLVHTNKPITDRKSIQLSINKTINFTKFIGKLKKRLESDDMSLGHSAITGFTGVTPGKPYITLGKDSSEMGIPAPVSYFKVDGEEFSLNFEEFLVNNVLDESRLKEVYNMKDLINRHGFAKGKDRIIQPVNTTTNPIIIREKAAEIYNRLRIKADLEAVGIPVDTGEAGDGKYDE